ncbi:ribonuclease H-like domain-containing protein [Aspergillus alliaceus]|uniref:Ribonuclease n=1 Tax=Petromyces alliaceus TaxID=209559 RepID=A0A5N6FJA3_PETAA|nr:ribonuclease H-like domain-containing protein [Aspergillus alliaceus]KAB8228703.1 ribonuclease H-like domain-containing protein [Aspergillus alliaceus]KAE8385164.1 ribonuclease H-like domain-containing protein [Aspergillus alliaceus]
MDDTTQRPSSTFQDSLTSAGTFVPPNINRTKLYAGDSYSYYSQCPLAITALQQNANTVEVDPTTINISRSKETHPESYLVLGVDEAGRGPVLGPMVYSAFYLPHDLHHSLLARDYSFNDSKVLTPGVRANLMRLLCTPGTPLFESCGWATKLLSARDISSGMMRPSVGVYNLNAQAMDATVELIRGIVEERKVDIREVFIDTIGNPATYQQKLERIFPSLKITVAKKADSLYPCVSAASVAAKVTRDIALELCQEDVLEAQRSDTHSQATNTNRWGSGYPSDSKCVSWLRRNMDPIFGWGNECRFSWGTAKEVLEMKSGVKVDWPLDQENAQLREFFLTSETTIGANQELRDWFGQKTAEVL